MEMIMEMIKMAEMIFFLLIFDDLLQDDLLPGLLPIPMEQATDHDVHGLPLFRSRNPMRSRLGVGGDDLLPIPMEQATDHDVHGLPVFRSGNPMRSRLGVGP
jgi:hypothetical protein